MTETFCTSGAVKLKAGANVSTAITGAQYTQLINQAESIINDAVKIESVNLVSDFANMNADVKKILEDAASSRAALGAINYDMSGYTSRQEAQTMLDVNYVIFTDCMQLLKEKKVTDFIRSFNS
jgi:hypothetical protein